MGIRTKRLPEYGVTLVIYSGRLSLDQLRRQVGLLDTDYTGRWLNYFDATADLSGLDIASIPALKRSLGAKLRALHGENPVISAIVWGAAANEPFPRFWGSYVGSDQAYPAEPVAFANVEAACDWLNLPAEGRKAVIDAVEGRAGHDPDARELAGAGPGSGC